MNIPCRGVHTGAATDAECEVAVAGTDAVTDDAYETEILYKGGITMKIVITSAGNDLSAAVDSRFGRAINFILYDTDAGTFTVHDNRQNLNAMQGAGIQAAQNVADLGADAVISGHVGPKAFAVLQKAGIEMYTGATGTIQDAIDAFANGTLKKTDSATVDGHWI